MSHRNRNEFGSTILQIYSLENTNQDPSLRNYFLRGCARKALWEGSDPEPQSRINWIGPGIGLAVTKDSRSQISNKCPPGLHFFPPQIHPECSLSRRKQARPGESSSCVCRSPGPGHPGIPPPSGSHVFRKASPSCLGSPGFPRVG